MKNMKRMAKWLTVAAVATACATGSGYKSLPIMAQHAPLVETCNPVSRPLVQKLRETTVMIRGARTTGSGVILWKKDGKSYILTNKHVVDEDEELIIKNKGQTFRTNKVYYHPEELDLAILEVEGDVGPAAELVKATPSIGDSVIVVGAPMGFEDSLTRGIISNIIDRGRYRVIQTDAAINPGNSGGGIYNEDGELVAIPTYKILIDPFQTAEGMGFAILLDRLPELKEWRKRE